MRYIGQSFLFDYGDFVVRVSYRSDSQLEWEQTKGPQAGLKGEEQYDHAAIRDEVVFFWTLNPWYRRPEHPALTEPGRQAWLESTAALAGYQTIRS
jgi:MoaF-like